MVKAVKDTKIVKEEIIAVKLFSRLDHSVFVSYGDTSIMIPAYAKGIYVTEPNKLGELPKGITKVLVKK